VLFLAQGARLPAGTLLLAQGGCLTSSFSLLSFLVSRLLRLLMWEGGPELPSDGLLLFLAQGGWGLELFCALFLAQGGDGVELLVFLRN
jgi:hypothetical protein